MLKKKLLTSYYNAIIVLIIVLMTPLTSCSYKYLYTKDVKSYVNLIYVDTISNDYGMLMVSQLRCHFNNINYSTTKYILKVTINIQENLQLNDKYGFSTQGELYVITDWQILDKDTRRVYITSEDMYPAFYNIMPSGYATLNNKEHIINLALKCLSKNISLKVIGLLKKYNGDLTNIKNN